MLVTQRTFINLALPMLGRARHSHSLDFSRAFRSYFGMSPLLCVHVWDELDSSLPKGASPRHLLWSLAFLKIYATEDVMVSIAKTTRKTFRKWVKVFVDLLYSGLHYVSTWPYMNLP